MNSGKVYLVGAGPGAVDLLTLRAWRLLAQADVVLYDRLVNPVILEEIRPGALLIDVGKRVKQSSRSRQNTIHQRLIQHARTGRRVIRLKGGDPFVFGRGAEEVAALAKEGIRAEVVPGISSAIAAPAAAGIPVTLRGVAASFGVFAGHPAEDRTDDGIDWLAAARVETAVFLMGVKKLPYIVNQLLSHGRHAETPVALIEKGTLPDQQVVVGTLASIVSLAGSIAPPAALVIGEVVNQRQAIAGLLDEKIIRLYPRLQKKKYKPLTQIGRLAQRVGDDQLLTTQGVP